MTIEQPKNNIQSIEYNALRFNGGLAELKEFLNNCSGFMDVNEQGFDVMIQSISDQLIDNTDAEITIGEIRPQLKFLREINFFLKGLAARPENI